MRRALRWLYRACACSRRRLATFSSSTLAPVAWVARGWSRDGRHVFVAGTRPARDPGSGLEVGPVSAVEVGTPAVRRIPDLDGAPSVSPSPDDRELAVALGGELRIVDAENPPLRVFFGALPLQLAKADYENRLREWEQWQPVAELAQG